MSDLIDRQKAIDAVNNIMPTKEGFYEPSEVLCELMQLPSARPERTDCDYCHEDSEGYVTPLEKNCHAFVRCSPIDGWVLSVKYGAWRKDVSIRYCPMCGRRFRE